MTTRKTPLWKYWRRRKWKWGADPNETNWEPIMHCSNCEYCRSFSPNTATNISSIWTSNQDTEHQDTCIRKVKNIRLTHYGIRRPSTWGRLDVEGTEIPPKKIANADIRRKMVEKVQATTPEVDLDLSAGEDNERFVQQVHSVHYIKGWANCWKG